MWFAVDPMPQVRIAADVHPENDPVPDVDGEVEVLDAPHILRASVGLVAVRRVDMIITFMLSPSYMTARCINKGTFFGLPQGSPKITT